MTRTPIFALLLAMPVMILGPSPSRASSLAAGAAHSCAVVDDAIRCWGDSMSRQLGDDEGGFEPTARKVAGLDHGQSDSQIAARGTATCAVVDGGVKCWGVGSFAATSESSPQDVPGLGSGVTAVATGASHACAVIGQGVECWGASNSYGQLGRPTPNGEHWIPAPVTGLEPGSGKGVVAIAAGYGHSCAAGGFGVKCWGESSYGQLGNSSQLDDSPTPVDVKGIVGAVSLLTATENGACAADAEGAKCWGQVNYPGSQIPEAEPVPGIPAGSVTALSGGRNHVCAVVDGSAYCFGRGTSGQLGNGASTSTTSAVFVATGIVDIAAGDEHTCARTQSDILCWGNKGRGQLGNGETVIESRPVPVGLPAGTVAATISAGGSHTCAQTTSGASYCWGLNESGQTGTGSSQYAIGMPQPVANLANSTGISAGGAHSCAIAFGQVRCWGSNYQAQVGQDPQMERYYFTPKTVPSIGQAQQIVASEQSSCALVENGSVYCFGQDLATANLGDGNSWTPELVPLIGVVTSITGGYSHTCVVINDSLKCWGLNYDGRLGVEGPAIVSTPVAPQGLADDVVVSAVATGASHTCAVVAGSLKCWGTNYFGELGRPTPSQPYAIPPGDVFGLGATVSAVSAGKEFTCAIESGALYCWGRGSSGQLGNGDLAERRETPMMVTGLGADVDAVDLGDEHACAIAQGTAYCWGSNDRGRLGTFKSWYRSTPQVVLLTDLFKSGFED